MSSPLVELTQVINTNDMEQTKTRKVNLDTLLVEEIGPFGKYQRKNIALLAFYTIFIGFTVAEYIFTTARIDTRCLIPECEDTSSAEFAPSWISNAIPTTASGSYDGCSRFANSSVWSRPNSTNSCPANLFDQDTVIPCDEYVYQNTKTVVYDLNLGCEEWRRSLIGSARTFGTLLALPLTGFISDRWGRRTALVLTAFNTALIGSLRYFSGTYYGFIATEFLEAWFGSGVYTSTYVLMLESVGPKYRVTASAISSTFFATGQILVGVMAWGIPSWRYLVLAIYIPHVAFVLYYWFIEESVRWYMSKGKYEKSEAVLKKIARVNGKVLSDHSLKELRESVIENEKKMTADESKKSWLIVEVFRHKAILLRCVISPVWWITMTMTYYGLSINAVNISGNSYLNFIAVVAVEIPAFWLAVLLMDRVGRKVVLAGGYWLCAAGQIAYIFMPAEMYSLSLVLYLVSKFCIAGVATSLHVYTNELYPTKYRHTLFAYSSMMGRIGSIVAPLTPALGAAVWEKLPFAMFAGLALLSGILVLFAPETAGTRLPDTMEEASELQKRT